MIQELLEEWRDESLSVLDSKESLKKNYLEFLRAPSLSGSMQRDLVETAKCLDLSPDHLTSHLKIAEQWRKLMAEADGEATARTNYEVSQHFVDEISREWSNWSAKMGSTAHTRTEAKNIEAKKIQRQFQERHTVATAECAKLKQIWTRKVRKRHEASGLVLIGLDLPLSEKEPTEEVKV